TATSFADSTNQNTPKILTVSGADIDSANLTFGAFSAPTHGTLGTFGSPSCTAAGAGSTCTEAVTYTPNSNYFGSDTFTYKANDGQIDSAPATVSLTIRPKVTVTADNKAITYGDPEPSFTYTTSPTTTLTSITCGVSGTHTAAGTYTITCSQPNGANPNYALVFVNGTLTIGKATPTITWANPADITYGTALSGTQLNATASVPGSFVYTPAAGTVLPAGANQTLSTTFTPTDTTNYTTANKSVTLTVNKAVLTVTADNQSRAFGAPDPTFTSVIAGFVNGETESG